MNTDGQEENCEDEELHSYFIDAPVSGGYYCHLLIDLLLPF